MMPDPEFTRLDRLCRAALAGDAAALETLDASQVDTWQAEIVRREIREAATKNEYRQRIEAGLHGSSRVLYALNSLNHHATQD